MPEAPVPSSTTPASGTGAAGANEKINVQHLADKVYSLLLADARLGLARGELHLPHSRKGEA